MAMEFQIQTSVRTTDDRQKFESFWFHGQKFRPLITLKEIIYFQKHIFNWKAKSQKSLTSDVMYVLLQVVWHDKIA